MFQPIHITRQQKVSDFSAKSGQKIAYIDHELALNLDYNIDAITKHIKHLFPVELGNESLDIKSEVRQLVLRKYIAALYNDINRIKLVSFIKKPDKHIFAHLSCAIGMRESHLKEIMIEQNDDKWCDFFLHHELFHAIDPLFKNLSARENPMFKHQIEFFADFGACLYLATQGVDMFVDVARYRAASVHNRQLNRYQSLSAQSLAYSTEHIYAIFKKEDINPIGMTLEDVVETTLVMRDKYALNETSFKRRLSSLTQSGPDRAKQSLETMRRTAHLKRIQKLSL